MSLYQLRKNGGTTTTTPFQNLMDPFRCRRLREGGGWRDDDNYRVSDRDLPLDKGF
jgi:hypothetical protein